MSKTTPVLLALFSMSALGIVLLPTNTASTSDNHNIKPITPPARPLIDTVRKMAQTDGPLALCFSEDANVTSQDIAAIEAYMQSLENNGLRYNAVSRWSKVAQGEPLSLTWSIVPDGVTVPALNGNTGPNAIFASFDAQFAAEGGRATWISLINQMFDRYQETSGVSYTRITWQGNDWDDGASFPNSSGNSRRGDIRIAATALQGPGASGVLAFNYFPNTGDMVIDTNDTWSNSQGNFRLFRNLLAHEHGHGLGLAHMCSIDSSVLMDPIIKTGFDGPSHDDIRAVQFLYGDPFEPNQTSSNPSAIGSIGPDQTLLAGSLPPPVDFFNQFTSILSLADAADHDWLSFNVTETSYLTVRVTPLGFTYDDSDQSSGCVYNTNTTNSLEIQDLRFELQTASGTLLASQSNTGPGIAEEAIDILVQPGQHLLHVFSSNGANQSQDYTVELIATPAECLSDSACDDGDPCNGIERCIGRRCLPGIITDCNANGIEDSCDITSGFSQDCNSNGIPDECDIIPQAVTLDSGLFVPFGNAFPASVTFSNIPTMQSDVTFTITAKSALGLFAESATVLIGGFQLGSLGSPGQDCPTTTPDQFQLTFPAATVIGSFLNPDGSLTVQALPTSAVDPNACAGDTWARITVTYTGQVDTDSNADSIPDSCATIICPPDITTSNTNPGDPNYGSPDGAVNGADLSYYVEFWLASDLLADLTTTNTNPGDPNYGSPDGTINGADLSFYVEIWLAGCP